MTQRSRQRARSKRTVSIQYLVGGKEVELHERSNETEGDTGTRWRPGRGWPVAIPATSPRGYIGGYEALNLPSSPHDADPGDWHAPWTWWTQTYLNPDGVPHQAEIWGPEGTIAGAPGTPRLRDARTALKKIEHPDGDAPEPIHAATAAQAVIDLAWGGLGEGRQPPNRRDTARWLSDAGDMEARRIAQEVGKRIEDREATARWLAWTKSALEGEDPFEREPARMGPNDAGHPVRVKMVLLSWYEWDYGSQRRSRKC